MCRQLLLPLLVGWTQVQCENEQVCTTYPALGRLNVMGLHNPQSAVLAAVIFNALIIIALVPLALRGVRYRPDSAARLLRRNLLAFGLGGVIAPFPGIWLIDRLVHLLRLA